MASKAPKIRLACHVQWSYVSRVWEMSKGKDKLTVLSKLHHFAGVMKIVCEGNDERTSRLKRLIS